MLYRTHFNCSPMSLQVGDITSLGVVVKARRITERERKKFKDARFMFIMDSGRMVTEKNFPQWIDFRRPAEGTSVNILKKAIPVQTKE